MEHLLEIEKDYQKDFKEKLVKIMEKYDIKHPLRG
jgi:hypothetical protein